MDNRGLAKVGIVALLAAMLAIPAALYVIPVVQATPDRSAWLKIVTEAWKGQSTNPALPDPGLKGFADRYNVTNVCVEVYRLKSGGAFDRAPGSPFYPNATGFVRITWPDAWENVTVVVKAKSYQGECITEGSPFSGLIVYWLTVNPKQGFLDYFDPTGDVDEGEVATFNDDGTLDIWADVDADGFAYDELQTLVATSANVIIGGSNLRSGPVDIVGDLNPAEFANTFNTPANAWVARASYIFKVFHEHTWYGTDDVLTYAIIFIYDVDHTPPNSEKSLLQAAITGSDGQSRYTKDIYPAKQGLGGGRYAENRLVPIPLQAIKLNTRQAFEGGIGAPGSGDRILAPHLNATVRVWWETVLVNQTFYVGREYNGSASYTTIDGKNRPDFGGFAGDPTIPAVTQGGITGIPAGPLSIVHNNTVYAAIAGLSDWSLSEDIENVANFQNNTVFYARFCVQDADLRIQHPEVGDKLVDAEVTINLKKKSDTPYYLSHNILTTDSGGCTDDPHKWPGYRSEFSKFARFPNGTNWGLRGSLNVSKAFDPKDDQGPAWRPGGYFEKAWGGSWTGPYVNADKNYSALIPVIKYMKTRTLADDPDYDGFDVQVKWKGGSRNNYGGTAVLVDSIRVRNPYAIALLYNYGTDALFGQWVFPYTVLANNKLWMQIHSAASVDIAGDAYDNPNPTMLEIMGPFTFSISGFDPTTGTYDITITATGTVVVNNATDPETVVDWTLTAGDTITIEDTLASIKKHDILTLTLAFAGSQGQVDLGVDGRDDYTTVSTAVISGGPFELEIWPGPPGTGTIRVLVTGHDINIDLGGPSLIDFTGAVLLKGPLDSLSFTELEEIEVDAITTLQGGVLSFGPIVKAMLTGADFDTSHTIDLVTIFDEIDIPFTTIDGGDVIQDVPVDTSISISSFVVPLPDISTDDKHLDDRLFGGYDDFALTGTGMVYITAWVHDIAFKVVDNMGNVLPASNTAVTLIRMNGPDVVRSGTSGAPDQQIGNLDWSYRQWAGAETGYAIFYQLPGDLAYGVKVTFDGVVVYEEAAEIPKLTQTELITIVANVFKLKVLLLDCNGNTLGPAYLSYIDPNGARRITLVDDFGAKDFGFVAGGGFQFTGVWWKGIWVKFVKAEVGDRELPLEPDGTLKISVESNVDSPVKLYANIFDIKFTTYDFNGEHIIPRLNVTLTWVGEHPLTGKKLWFLETFDPTGDTDPTPFNATVTVDQFLRYTVKYFQGKPSISGQLKSYGKAEYVFYQMPPTYYNITVTTVTDSRYDPDEEQTPGSALWPGRTVPVPYEIKILFSSTSAPPRIVTTPEDSINDRVVLRIFSTFNPDRQKFGRPVTDEWPFEGALKVYNPGGVGDFTGITECAISRNLYVWAHTFSKRIVDGAGQMRIGDATYIIVNDNGQPMLFYHPKDKQFYSTHYSFWTEDTLDTTWLYPDFQRLSVIWWNGSYRAEGLALETNMSFIVDKWWNKSAKPNYVWERHNFTVQPSEAHFKTMHPFVVGNWTKIQETVQPYGNAIIFEKETLLLPAPVTFVKPKAVDKGGAPLENALIEAWILNINASKPVSIAADSGTATITQWYIGNVGGCEPEPRYYRISWEWEKKMVADPDAPQRFKEVRWDRLSITISVIGSEEEEGYSVLNVGEAEKTIFVQVPPWPAKLFLRDVVDDGLDLIVTSKYIYTTVDNPDCPIDNNDVVSTPRAYPNGQLAYARWTTGPDGLIKSFTIPGYEGLLLLPTSGWLNHTFSAEGALGEDHPMKEEFHYQFNVVWKSAVVYSDNFVLDKKIVEFGASEVYDVRFMFTLSNSTDPAHAVRNLNLWIYYPNVTTWWEQDFWHTVPPTPQDYEACEDSAFPCEKRVTLISSADADGVVEFSKIPGPRFMNTTWKYVFSANHSAVTWLKDLVATQFVLNNETFGDGPLKTVTTSRITVPIMLNAARQLSVVLLTWRDEQGVPTAYPVQGYTVKLQARRLTTTVDTGVLTKTSDAFGFATFDSDPTDVRKVFWAGLTIRYRVEPPAYVNEPDDAKWRDWMKNLNVQLVEQAYNTPTRRSSFAYFPDEEPTHWAITTISTTFDPDGFCIGLCTYFDKDQGRTISKPFVITVNYAAVTVRAIDFNGRPLAGAFVELVDRASGRIAGWSYTANNSWTARPIDIQELFMFHRGKLLDPRPIGGAGYTAIMNLTFGKWNYDANNDDVVDASGVRNPLQLIIRVYWLANDPTPDNAVGNLWPVWPFRDETAPLPRHVKVYDSDFDETDAAAKTLVVPHSEAAFGIRLPDRTISASDPVSRGVHRDVTTAVFDFKALLNYGGKTLPDEILKRLEVFVYKKVGATTELSLRFTEGVGMTKGTFTINRLPRGVYEIEVRFGAAGTIFKRTFDISTVNVGTVQVEASLPFTDLSFEVTDLKGRPLTIAPGDVTIEPAAYYFRREVAGNVITITALYTGAPVTITVRYSSPTYGTSVQVTLTDTADGIRTRLIGGRTLQLPVDDVVITAVDAQGRPVGGAVVTFKGVTKTTGSDGKAVFERVPLGTEDAPIAYNVRVSVEGVEVYNKDEPISVARKEISVLAQLFALTVRVVGELGQGLQGASVQLLRAGTTVATGSADSAGAVRFERLAPASYEVRAQYKGFSGTATVSLDALRRGEVVEIRLPVYVEVIGIPMSLATLLALAIGIILLVIVLAIIISEYRWWRGRRLGVYAPPPPKAPAK